METKSRVDSPLIEEAEDLLEFARYPGPGTMIYPSPRPEVRDLALPPMLWVQVDPLFRHSGAYVRDRKNKVFETTKAEGSPDDLDLSIKPELLASLTPDQRELVRSIILDRSKTLKPVQESALTIATHIDQGTGFPVKDSLVTIAYLREHHRPFLLAIQDLENRFQKRKSVLALVKKQLDLIAGLPGK